MFFNDACLSKGVCIDYSIETHLEEEQEMIGLMAIDRLYDKYVSLQYGGFWKKKNGGFWKKKNGIKSYYQCIAIEAGSAGMNSVIIKIAEALFKVYQ